MSDGWFIQRTGPFLKKGTTLEELSIEFDLSWRDVFDFKKLRSNDIKLAANDS